ncbi:MAG: endolytic transglycosylase MltG [bacterium]|nr:endolytic transglycosylase MltG [bacterium]
MIDILLLGPKSIYQRITILEGRNTWDIDGKLTKEGLIATGDYRTFITNPTIIDRYTDRYAFLQQARDEGKSLLTLEGYLYPETYMIDPTKDVIDQLVYLQLDAFDERIRNIYKDQLKTLSSLLQSKGYNFRLSSYAALILASIIEKEERTDANKPTIASIFFNRLDAGMKLDADITLCYGLQQPYTSCTPTVIINNLTDASNPYNTRAVSGLPPTPIASIHANSVSAVLSASKTNLFFYLHDLEGKLHTSKDISEHNSNKSKYLP